MSKLEPELLPDGAILAPVTGADGRPTTVRLEPGEDEHTAWLAYMQRQRDGGPAPPPAQSIQSSPWVPRRVAMPTWGIVAASLCAILVLFWYVGALDGPLSHVGLNKNTCAQNAFGATFCGDDLKSYCERFKVNNEACRDVGAGRP